MSETTPDTRDLFIFPIFCKKISLLCFFILQFSTAIAGVLPDANELLNSVSKANHYDRAEIEFEQTIFVSGGNKRVMKVKSYAINDGEKQLTQYMSPARVRGSKVLFLNNGVDIWYYSQRSGRTRRIGSHARKQKVNGSNFSYEDILAGDLNRLYTGKTIRVETVANTPSFVLRLKPTPEGPSYDHIIAWVGKKDALVRRIDYFESANAKPFKRLFVSDFRVTDGRFLPWRFMMESLDGSGKTINQIKVQKLKGTTFSDGIFSSKNLKRKIR